MKIQIAKITYLVNTSWGDYAVERLAQTLISDTVIVQILQGIEVVQDPLVYQQIQATLKQSLVISISNSFDCSESQRIKVSKTMSLAETSQLLDLYREIKTKQQDISQWLESFEPKQEIVWKKQTYYIQKPLVFQNELINLALKESNLFDFLNWFPFALSIRRKDWMWEGEILTSKQFKGLSTGEKIACIAEHSTLNEKRIRSIYNAPAGVFMPLVLWFIDFMGGIGVVLGKYKGQGEASPMDIENCKHDVAKFLGVQLPEIQVMEVEKYVNHYDRMMQNSKKK